MGADVVHDHTLLGPVYAAQSGVPVVTTNHGPFTGELARLLPRHRRAGPRRGHLGPPGVDGRGQPRSPRSSTTGSTSTAARATGDGGYALFLGRMSPDKGVDTAARVAREAGVPLLIASRLSEPAEHEYFRRAVEPLLGGDVRYVGEVGGAHKCELIGRAACLLNPIAWDEPFGMVMVEALARGTPVVATPRGSVPELVDDGVTGFVRSSPEDLAARPCAVPALDRPVPAGRRRAVLHRAHGGRPPRPLPTGPRRMATAAGRLRTAVAQRWTMTEESQAVPAATVTLVEGASFAICDMGGDIGGRGAEGLFVGDTRICSRLVVTVDGAPVETLAVAPRSPFAASFVGRTGDRALLVFRDLWVGRGARLDICLRNLGNEACHATVRIGVDADLADLLEVKAGRARPVPVERAAGDGSVTLLGEDGRRGMVVRSPGAQASPAGTLRWRATIPARAEWVACVELAAVRGGEELAPRHPCGSRRTRPCPPHGRRAGSATSPASIPTSPACRGRSSAPARTWERCASSTRTTRTTR